ncbi:MAG TPA: hypothetical protein PKI32_00340 [Opitutales bacterium]|nr:hypothetical protein [Opitutales bacterium]
MKIPAFSVVVLSAGLLSADVDLSGVWRVKGVSLAGEAILPGTLADAKLGHRWTRGEFERTLDKPQSGALTREYQYLGKAVYSRAFTVTPEEAGKPLELVLERVMWASEAALDGRKLGMRDSLGTPHVYFAGPLAAGEHRLEITVDNSPRYGFSRHAHSYGPSMQSVWHGVIGSLKLRAANPLAGAKVYAAAPANRELKVQVPGTFAGTAQLDGGLGIVKTEKRDGFLVLSLDGEPEYWSEFHPRLYTLTLRDGAFTKEIRFGFRTFSAGPHLIRLNGHDSFTRANVENCNFAAAGTPWMTKAEWLKMFRTLKNEDGVNTFRFHTWCPPEAAFAAADEAGVYLQPEAGIWTDGWMGEADAVGYGKPVDGFVRRELRAIMDAYGNHPSFLSLAVGNELGTSNWDEADKIVREIKAYDPRVLHYFCSARRIVPSDDITLTHRLWDPGITIRERLFPRTDWDYEKDYLLGTRPTVAHEIGQWPVYPRFDEELARFTGVLRPWNLERLRDRAEKEGTRRFEKEYHYASAALSRLIYKEEVESFLRTPSCAGLQLLSVQDYTGQGEALIGWRDPFYGLKEAYRGGKPFADIWGGVNHLARFAKYDWLAGETYTAKLFIRNLTEKPLPAGTAFPWRCAGRSGTLALPAAIQPGAVGAVGEVSIPLDVSLCKSRQALSFGANEWPFWVYPAEEKCAWPDGVTVTASFAEMEAALKAGKTVLYTGASRLSDTGAFKPVYWSSNWFPARYPLKATLGTWFEKNHPAFAGFVTDFFTDWQWYNLSEGARIHRLTGLPDSFRPVALSVNDFHFSLLAATMFDLKVGGGRLFVCGYDLGKDTPAAKRLRASLAAYLAGPAAPGTTAVPLAWLGGHFAPKADKLVPPAADAIVHNLQTNWTARSFSYEIRLAEPVTGAVELVFDNPEGAFRTGRGLVDGHVFEIPSQKGLYTARAGIIREDLLDGKLEIAISCMTGPNLILKSIRVIREK